MEVFNISKPETLVKAIVKYGHAAQIDIAIEELSKLIKALLKHRRAINYSGDIVRAEENIAEEMADVYIMLAQLWLMFDNYELFKEKIKEKVDRLEERLKGE